MVESSAPDVVAPETWRSLLPRSTPDRIAAACFALLIFAFGAFDVHTYDTGLYVAKGRYTFEHAEIPTPTRMLCSERAPDVSHTEKWLFQVIVAVLDTVGGATALALFGLFSIAVTFALLAAAARVHTGGWVLPVWCVLFGCLIGYERFTMRPELITFPMAAAFVFLFERHHDRVHRQLWLLPLLQIVWTNSHPVFPLGPLLCALYAGDPLLRGLWRAWRDERWPAHLPGALIRQRILLALAVTGACLVNPSFITGALYPFQFYAYIQAHAEVFTRHVTEFRGTFDYETFPTWATASFQAALLATPVALGIAAWNGKVRPAHALIFLIFAWLACTLRRNLGVYAVVSVPVLAISVRAAWSRVEARWQDATGLASWLGAFALLMTSIYFAVDLTTNRFYIAEREPRRFGLGLTEISYPVEAVRYIDSQGLHGNCFTNWDAGSYVLWAAHPKSRPYISSEGDYSFALYDEYRKILTGELPYAPVFDRYRIRYALIRYSVGDTERLVRALAHDQGWVLGYADTIAVVFLRKSGENTEAIQKAQQADPIHRPADDGATGYEAAWPWFRLSILFDLLGRQDEVMLALRKAVDAYPNYAEAQNNLGAALGQAQDLDGAERAFRASIAANPNYFTPYHNLGSLYYKERKDDAKAEEVYRQALGETVARGWFRMLGGLFRESRALRMREVLLLNSLAKVQARAGRYDEAIETLGRSIAVMETQEAFYTRFILYRDALKDPERAQRDWARAQEFGPIEAESGQGS